MDPQKINLIIQNIESLLILLKLEMKDFSSEKSNNLIKLEDLIKGPIDDYEPNYYEEED
jgi:hypothetical protein